MRSLRERFTAVERIDFFNASAREAPFDMFIGEFSHQGPLCTFEVLSLRFGITDPAVDRIARIVHDIDMHDTKYGSAETPTVARMVEGLRQVHPDDHVLLQHGAEMFEALASSFACDTR